MHIYAVIGSLQEGCGKYCPGACFGRREFIFRRRVKQISVKYFTVLTFSAALYFLIIVSGMAPKALILSLLMPVPMFYIGMSRQKK
jgi:hypothetical protein